jgi:hypothetical protein
VDIKQRIADRFSRKDKDEKDKEEETIGIFSRTLEEEALTMKKIANSLTKRMEL